MGGQRPCTDRGGIGYGEKNVHCSVGLFFACLHPLEAHADAMPDVIRYEELETLVKASSPQIQMEQAQYDSRLAR